MISEVAASALRLQELDVNGSGMPSGTGGYRRNGLMILSLVLFVIGLGLVISFAEQLVKGAIGTSLGFGISPFLVSVIFIGFDPENLAVGAAGRLKGSRVSR